MVLLVGGTGRLGTRVGRRLLAEGRRVRALARSAAKAEDLARLGAEVVAGDLRDRASLERAIRGVARIVTIPGPGDHPIDLMAIDDVAHDVLLALDHPEARDRTLEVGGPENLTLNQVADAFERHADRPARRRYLPLRLLRAVGACALPFAPDLGRALATAAYRCSSHQAFDAAPLVAAFPRRLTRLADLARRDTGALRRGGPSARRVNREA